MLILQVFVMKDGVFEGSEMASGARVEIGRDPSCALVLDHDSCSRRHAVIYELDGKLVVEDAGSANGTFVNGEPVTAPRFIGPRDDIAVGAFTLKVKVMSSHARAAGSSGPQPAASPLTRILSNPGIPAQGDGLQRPIHEEDSLEETSTAPESSRTSSLNRSSLPSRSSAESAPPSGELALSDTAVSAPDVTLPDAPMPMPTPASSTSSHGVSHGVSRGVPHGPPHAAPRAAARLAPAGADLPGLGSVELASGDVPSIAFAPSFLDEELEPEPIEPAWSLVQSLLRAAAEKRLAGQKGTVVEVVHYRGEEVVEHAVIRRGHTFKLGARMTRAERRERGITRVVPVVKYTRRGAEVFRRGVSGRLQRQGQAVDLVEGKGRELILAGDTAHVVVGSDRVFVRFASEPELRWTADDAREHRFARRLNGIAAGTSVGLFALMAMASWIYQYRNADQEVIALEDEGFAEVEIQELKMEEPPKPPEPPEPVPEPLPTTEPEQQPPADAKPEKVAAKAEVKPTPDAKPSRPAVLDVLNNIPKVDDSASSQNLSAALSNIKGVRVPGATSGPRVSSLIGKGPSSGVQIGGAAGGLSTSGINSLLRKDGGAGALGGKGDRAVSGKVVGLKSQLAKKGEGELSKEEIQKVINAHIGEIQFCYEKQLRTQPGLAGRVVLEWGVNPQGKVSVVKVAQSSLQSADATSCMMGKLKAWKFPPPRGGSVTIVFPFVFNTV